MQLSLHFPQIPSCDTCEKFAVDTKTWNLTFYRGEPFPRKPHAPPPCHLCPKCDGEDEKSPAIGRKTELSEKNRRTLDLYWRQQATGRIEVDDVAARNLGIIHEIIERYKLDRQRQLSGTLALLTMRG